ncbi:MAG: hypothetical protein HY257_10460, partial [Chloroflexi bacterium]|nr:hypothetical protein [Chloroflexota bacterium]
MQFAVNHFSARVHIASKLCDNKAMLSPIVLSLQITLAATIGIFVIGLALALFLARSNARAKILLELFINLPLVLPPSVVGYYLLITLGRDSIIAQSLNLQILFTPTAAIIAAIIVALPLM